MYSFSDRIRVLPVAFFCLIAAASVAQAQSGAYGDAALAQKLNNPIASLISVPLQTNYDRGYGTGDGYKVYTNFQPVIPVPLGPDWNVISRTIVPVVWDQKNISATGNSGRQSGVSDITQSLFFSPTRPVPTSFGEIVWGAGPVLTFPTGNASPFLGTGKWGAGPTAVVVLINGGWTGGVLVNHVWDYAGQSDRNHISSTFLQPFLTYTTRDAWTFSINSESSYDWIAQRWSVPINFGISKLVSIGGQKVSFQGRLRYWAASPAAGPDGFGYTFNMTFLFPK